jgi:hypothetical protein
VFTKIFERISSETPDGGQKGMVFSRREFLPAVVFAASFFAAAIFRASEAGAPPKKYLSVKR